MRKQPLHASRKDSTAIPQLEAMARMAPSSRPRHAYPRPAASKPKYKRPKITLHTSAFTLGRSFLL